MLNGYLIMKGKESVSMGPCVFKKQDETMQYVQSNRKF